MTREEFEIEYPTIARKAAEDPDSKFSQRHEKIVFRAHTEGRQIPEEVLNEYGLEANPVEIQPYTMTFREFKEHLVRTEGYQAIPANLGELRSQRIIHRNYIRQAVLEGKTIPRKVWDEYWNH